DDMGSILHGTIETVPKSTGRRRATSKILRKTSNRKGSLFSPDIRPRNRTGPLGLDRGSRFCVPNRLRLAKTYGSDRRGLASVQTLSNTSPPKDQIDQAKPPKHQKNLSRRNRKSRRSDIQTRPRKITPGQESWRVSENWPVQCSSR